MKLSIVTINYNSSECTKKLLKSLSEQTDKDFQTIVIDNASDEADFNALLSTMGTITFVMVPMVDRNSENLGFSGGNNVGIKKALENGANWVILLNNDVWAEKGFVSDLKAKLSGLGGIVGMLLVEGDHIAHCGKIEWLKPTLRHQYNCNGAHGNSYAIGGAVAVHKDVFQKIGLWDEKYFLYFEDADFSLRARKAGIPISFEQGVMIYHNVSSTTKKLGSSALLRYHYRNALYFNLKNGPWYIKLAVWPWSWWVIIKQVLKIIIYHNRDQSLAILRGVLDFYRNKMGKIQ